VTVMGQPLDNLDAWDDFVSARYPKLPGKTKEAFRDYRAETRPCVREFIDRTTGTRHSISCWPKNTSTFRFGSGA